MPRKPEENEVGSRAPFPERKARNAGRQSLSLSDLIDFVKSSSEDDEKYAPDLKRINIITINIHVEGDRVSGGKQDNRATISNSSQVSVAQGKGAKSSIKARDAISSEPNIDLKSLVSELDQLRIAMRAEASKLEHDEAVASVGQAERAADKGDKASVMERLKSAGQWALGISEKLALTAASEAIKTAMK